MCEEIDVYTADSGKILKEIIKLGYGELVATAAAVRIQYTGCLLNGTKFDSSKDRPVPFKFNVGEGKVIPGLDLGIISMKIGEKAILTIAPEYAYGSGGNPPIIPPNATLKFEVEVLDWEHEDLSPKKDGSILRRHRITAGTGYIYPQKGSLVEVHLNGKFKDKDFEDRDVLFRLGDGDEENVVKGVEIALQKFKAGEKSVVSIKSKHAFDNPVFKNSGVPRGQTVQYTIELKQFERLKRSWSMDEDDKIQISKIFKERGNQLFKRKKYTAAINMYRKVLGYLVDKDDEEIKKGDEACTQLVLSAYLNVALCSLRIEDYEMAYESALKAVRTAPENDKAHYRCGQALLGLSDSKKAMHHFDMCLKIDPNNSEAKALYSQTMQTVKDRAEKEKKRYLNMFEKFSEVNVQEDQLNN